MTSLCPCLGPRPHGQGCVSFSVQDVLLIFAGGHETCCHKQSTLRALPVVSYSAYESTSEVLLRQVTETRCNAEGLGMELSNRVLASDVQDPRYNSWPNQKDNSNKTKCGVGKLAQWAEALAHRPGGPVPRSY